MDPTTADEIAHALDEAERTGIPIQQLSLAHPELSVDDAYEVQRRWVETKLARGRVLRGRKVGLTSRAMQQSLGIDEPDFGALLDDMFFDDGGTVPRDRFIFPRVEVELAFVLAQPLHGPGISLYDVLDATRYLAQALEILDARVQMRDEPTGHTRTIVDTVADNAADAGVVLGSQAVRPHEVDLRWVAAVLTVNETVEETGVAAGVLNHPARAVAWLANKLDRYGLGLDAGQVILSGSFTRAIPARVGDTFHADFRDLGTVTCRFV